MTPTEATAFAGNGFAPDLAAIHPSWRLFIDQQMSTPKGQLLTARLREWVEAGDLTMPYDVTRGLENTLTAYAKLFTGGNIGKVIVELEE